MTNQERLEIFNMPTIAVYSESAFSGFALKRLQHGIIDIAAGVWYAGDKITIHEVRVFYTRNDAYIRVHGRRIKLSEMLRVES